jgi:hypothetical protein
MEDLVDYGYDLSDGQLIWSLPGGSLSDLGLSDFPPPIGCVRSCSLAGPNSTVFPRAPDVHLG